jgi:glycosyltransferase involved in cell wall biosynthesis
LKENSKVHHQLKDRSRTLSHQPDISFIIPVFNMADTLPEMLETTFRCSFGTLEVIVINDGSTDQTERVIEKYEGRSTEHPNISFQALNMENCGKPAAINRALQVAKGEYLAIADADDVVLVDEYEKLWQCCRNHMPDLTIGSFGIEANKNRGTIIRRVSPEISSRGLLRKLAYSPFAPVHLNAVLIRRKLFLSIGGFDETMIRAQDKDLMIRLLLKTDDILICDAVPYIYRKNHSGLQEKVRKRLQWIYYRQKVLQKNFVGFRLIGAVSLQFIFDMLKLSYELFNKSDIRE